jgi:hypothetical protein
MNGKSAHRVVDVEMLEQIHRQDDQNARYRAQDAGANIADPIARAGDRHEAGEEAVNEVGRVPRLRAEERQEDCGESAAFVTSSPKNFVASQQSGYNQFVLQQHPLIINNGRSAERSKARCTSSECLGDDRRPRRLPQRTLLCELFG